MTLSIQQQKLAAVFPEVSWSTEDRVCIFRPHGVLTPTVAARLVAWLKEIETDTVQPFNRFSDLTQLQKIAISISDVKETAYWRRTSYDGPPVKSAFLAQNDESLLLAHAYFNFMFGSQITVRVFQSRAEAAAWLGVSEESLEAGNS